MHRIPDEASDETINQLFEGELATSKATAAALGRLEKIMHEPVLNAETLANGRVNEIDLTRRRYDIDVEYDSFRPVDQRWRAIDLNTFDGGPDAPGCFQGYGASEKQARMALLDLFADYDERPRPPRGRIVNLGNPETPPEVIDDITFDDDLEDHDER